MGSGIFFPLCAIPFSILIIVLFYVKGHINNLETKIYKVLIVSNFFGLIIELLCTWSSYIYNLYPMISIIIYKLYLFYIILWTSTFFYYIFCVSKGESNFHENRHKYFIIYYIVNAIILLILPIDVVIENNFQTRYTSGLAVLYTYLISGFAVILIVLCMVLNRRRVRGKKFIPVYIFMLIGTLAISVQFIHPEILMMTYVETLINVVMFFTMENPDVRMIEQLNIAREQADKANQAKTDFLSNMSHEIRTPLNAIVGFSQTLYEEDIPESAKSQVEDIISASNSLLEIVNGILDISKIEANKLEIINDEYNFKKIFDELVSLSRARMGEKPLDFRIHYDESIPEVLYGDKLRIKQVILNILTNSIKYTKEGFIDFTVNSVKKGDVCRLIISVEDSGVGIKKENLDKLFTKFQRFEEKNTTIEGTGLGLAITKKLVELMGGQIIVQSVYGKGSKFTIVLNQKVVLNPVKKQEENPISLDTETFDLTGKKILVVDDNKLNLKVAERLLQKYNLTVEVVASGMECLEKINAKNSYDLIFLDDMMPKMNGVQTLHELKKIENFHIPVVILTANAISGMREKYLQDGFDEYLAKPIERNELNRILKKFLMKE